MEKTQRLVDEATCLKKAWVFSMAWPGQKDWLSLPNYSSLPKKELKREIDKLEADFAEALGSILADSKRGQVKRIARWFAAKFDDCHRSATPIFYVGRVHEVQRELGRLSSRRPMEFPP